MADPSCVKRWKWEYHPPGVSVWVTREGFLCQWSTRSGFVYMSRYSAWSSQDGEDQKAEVMHLIWEEDVKRKDVRQLQGVQWHVGEDKLLKDLPNLSEFLRAAAFEGEEGIRDSPTITLWASGGEWKVSVRDRAEQLVMWLSATSLRELAKLLESMVGSPDGPWRHDDHASDRNGKRAKKST